MTPSRWITLIRHSAVLALAVAVSQSGICQNPAGVTMPAGHIRLDYLTPDQTGGQHSFTLGSQGEIVFEIASSSPDLIVQITAPAGEVVDASNVPNVGGEYASSDLGEHGHRQLFILPSLGAGAYSVTYTLTAPPTQFVPVALHVTEQSDLGAALFTARPRGSVLQEIPLTVGVFDGGSPILGLTPSVNILRDGSPSFAVTLADDGAGFDAAVGDGLYTGVFVPQAPGRYSASGVISGLSASGEPFSRDVGTVFDVVPNYGTLLGTFRDEAVDSDQDGELEAVAVEVDVNAAQAGAFQSFITIGNGTEELTARADADLSVGQGVLRAVFDVKRLRAFGSGPYEIDTVSLSYRTTEGFVDVDERFALGFTQAYPDTEFEPEPLTLVATSDSAQELIPGGPLGPLVVQFDLHSEIEETRIWRVVLTSQTGVEIAKAQGVHEFTLGLNTILAEFAPSSIAVAGFDGPYLLANLRIAARWDAATFEDAGQTQAYTADQFHGGFPRVDYVNPPFAEPGETVRVLIQMGDTFLEAGDVSVDAGAGITVQDVVVEARTRVLATFVVAPDAVLDVRDVTLTTGTGSIVGFRAFRVERDVTLVSVSPPQGQPGDTLQVTVEGQNTNFVNGATTLGMSAGVSVQSVSVVDSNTLTATIQIASGAAPGVRTVTAVTGFEVALIENGFEIVSDVPPTPVVTLTGPSTVDEGASTVYAFAVGDPGGQAFSTVAGQPSCGAAGNLVPGSLTTSADGATGTFACSFPDGPAASDVSIQLSASGGELSNVASVAVSVANVPPSVWFNLSANPVSEGGAVQLSGTVADPGALDDLSVAIDWGDGGAPTALSLAAGVTSFSADRQFLDDNPTGTPQDVNPVSVTVTDKDQGSSSQGAPLTVENVPPVISTVTGPFEPLALGAQADLSAAFGDVGMLDTHSCTFSWDDGSADSPGVVTETDGSGSCEASRTYAGAGVYSVGVRVEDDDTGAATGLHQFVVVYDPTVDKVRGNGQIYSAPGAYVADPTIEGLARFGFISEYHSGAQTPTGNTRFHFKAADFLFIADEFDWLVVAGAKAQFKGTGSIHMPGGPPVGNYGFLLTATDGEGPGGGGVDKFRIKIWDKATEQIVFDNRLGSSDDIDDANPQAIEPGGDVVVVGSQGNN